MEKFIYKIENKINGKVYIGQTNNLKRRIKEHKYDKRKNHPVHNALIKYGFENFNISILYYGENYNEEEKKYIRLYKSNDKRYGYNIVNGGQDSSGENNPQSKLSQREVDYIIEDLIKDRISIPEIASKYNTTIKTVRNINTGISWKNNKLKYPLRKSLIKKLDTEQVVKIKELLKNTDMDIESIANMLQINKNSILNINNGMSYKDDNEEYPLRELGIKQKELNEIIELLKDKTVAIKEIAQRYNKHLSQIYRINRGESWYNNSIKYPIRDMTIERNELGQYICGNL